MRNKEEFGHRNKLVRVCKYLFLLILCPVLLLSCTVNKMMIDQNNVESIKFWYIPKDVCSMADIRYCEEVVLSTEVNNDTVIVDKSIINRYIAIINKSKPLKKKCYYDLRVTSLVKFKQKDKKVIVCISFYNDVMLIDNKQMKVNKEMFEFLDEVLFSHFKYRDFEEIDRERIRLKWMIKNKRI